MNYQVGDSVIFYRSNSEKALEIEITGTIEKVNKKTYRIFYTGFRDLEISILVKKELVFIPRSNNIQ
jgi:hypothetical protein